MITRIHVFTDGEDDWFKPEDRKGIADLIRQWRKDFGNRINLRIYEEVYEDEEAVERDVYDEDCIFAVGGFPS